MPDQDNVIPLNSSRSIPLSKADEFSLCLQFGLNVAAMACHAHFRLTLANWDQECIAQAEAVCDTANKTTKNINFLSTKDIRDWRRIAQAWSHAALLWTSPLAYGGLRRDIGQAAYQAALTCSGVLLAAGANDKNFSGGKELEDWRAWARTGGAIPQPSSAKEKEV